MRGVANQLSKAAIMGRKELLNRALAMGAKVNAYDSKNDTALNQACSKGRIEAIAYLIEQNADVNLLDKLKGRSVALDN